MCSTILSNKKYLTKDLKDDNQLEGGEFDCWIHDNHIVSYNWKVSKSLYVISNFHGSESITLQGKQKCGSKINVNCPVAVKDNTYIGALMKMICLLQVIEYLENKKNCSIRFVFLNSSRTFCNTYIAYQRDSCESNC